MEVGPAKVADVALCALERHAAWSRARHGHGEKPAHGTLPSVLSVVDTVLGTSTVAPTSATDDVHACKRSCYHGYYVMYALQTLLGRDLGRRTGRPLGVLSHCLAPSRSQRLTKGLVQLAPAATPPLAPPLAPTAALSRDRWLRRNCWKSSYCFPRAFGHRFLSS